MSLRNFESSSERGAYLSEKLRLSLRNTQKSLIDNEESIHCENLIGAVSLPLGVAGPLHLLKRSIYIPLATTEGALVASIQRGIKAINQSKIIDVFAYKTGATRGPVFFTGSVRKSIKLAEWIKKNEKSIARVIKTTSHHLNLKKTDIKINGSYVFVRFQCDTDEAMGMNMVTIGVAEAVKLITQKTGFDCLAVAGNYDIDKKPAWLNMIKSRGYEVCAEVKLRETIVRNVLKTTSPKLFNTWLSKCMIGSAMAGSLGFNAHYANVIAAFYTATGQDIAHVVEGSIGITTMYLEKKSITVSVYMPSIMMGLVGGGTKLKTQSEARSLTGARNTQELAQILGVAVLAGELSLLASLSQGTLARAHKSLGR